MTPSSTWSSPAPGCWKKTNSTKSRLGPQRSREARNRCGGRTHPQPAQPAPGRANDPQRAPRRWRAHSGLQHKYRETVLFFPAHGQTCHAYCTFCFRWAQFIGDEDLKFANKEVDQLVRYLRQHPEVSDVLFTGGDPMVMKAKVLERYIRPILEDPELEHIWTIRIGTKSVAYWPQRLCQRCRRR